MAINTTYDVAKISDIDKNKVKYYGKKVRATVPFNTTVNIDYALTDDVFITGAKLIITNGTADDFVKFQVVHPTAGVLNEFIDWYASDMDKELPYPAKLPAGLILRIVYTSASLAVSPVVRANYSLHRIVD